MKVTAQRTSAAKTLVPRSFSRRHASRIGRHRRVSMTLLAIFASTGLSLVNASPALAYCSGEACNYTEPAGTGCSDSTATPYIAQLSNGGMTVSDIELRYSYSCRTVWSRLTHFYASNAPSYAHPWTNRVGGGPDTYWMSGACDLPPNPWDYRIWSLQINDADYLAYAWGGVTQLNGYCGSPTFPSSLQSYNAAGPF